VIVTENATGSVTENVTGNEIATGSVTVNRRTRDLATIGSELIQRKGSVTVEEVIGLNLLVAIVTGWKRKASP
jgi:hypothetical protein